MGHTQMTAVKSGCLYILYIEHGPCSHGHELSLSATFVRSQFKYHSNSNSYLDNFSLCVYICLYHIAMSTQTTKSFEPQVRHNLPFYHLPPPSIKTHHDEKGGDNERAGREREGGNDKNEPKRHIIVWAQVFFSLIFVFTTNEHPSFHTQVLVIIKGQ